MIGYKALFWQEQTVVGNGNRVSSSETRTNHLVSSEKDGWLNGVAGGLIADVSTPAKVMLYAVSAAALYTADTQRLSRAHGKVGKSE